MIGDKRKYCVGLVTLRTKVDAEAMPTGELDGPALEGCKGVTTVKDAMQSKQWNDYIQQGIDTYNKNDAVSNAQKIQKFSILPQDFSVGGGELTATLKLKRPVISDRYGDTINKLY